MPACLGRCTLQRERWYVIVDRAAQLLTAAELDCRQGGRRSGAAARNVGTERAPLAAAAAGPHSPATNAGPDALCKRQMKMHKNAKRFQPKVILRNAFYPAEKNLQPMADQTL